MRFPSTVYPRISPSWLPITSKWGSSQYLRPSLIDGTLFGWCLRETKRKPPCLGGPLKTHTHL